MSQATPRKAVINFRSEDGRMSPTDFSGNPTVPVEIFYFPDSMKRCTPFPIRERVIWR